MSGDGQSITGLSFDIVDNMKCLQIILNHPRRAIQSINAPNPPELTFNVMLSDGQTIDTGFNGWFYLGVSTPLGETALYLSFTNGVCIKEFVPDKIINGLYRIPNNKRFAKVKYWDVPTGSFKKNKFKLVDGVVSLIVSIGDPVT